MALVAYKYERRGVLAINPRALLDSFLVDENAKPRDITGYGDCAVVDVRGPLETHAHPWCDSYESIVARVSEACKTSCKAVVLRFDSPGGDVSGCFDSALSVRAACDAAGKQLHAYVEGECASAAYAFAALCDSITISMTSLVGSIGVLSTRADVSEMNAARGLRIALVMSGARKGDGHPEMPISDAELENMQGIVDSMASVFFDLVAQGRGVSAEAIAQLQARTFHGETAVRAGLADAVGPLTTVLATVAGLNGGTGMNATAKAKSKMSYEEMRAMLAAAAEGDDPNAAAAKKALAAMDEHKAGDGDAPAKDDKAAGGGDDDAAPPAAPKKDEPAKDDSAAAGDADTDAAAGPATATAAMRMALKAQRELADMRAERTKEREESERTKLIASRPDMSEDMVALLERAPIELVREHIKALAPAKPVAATGGGSNPRVLKAGKPVAGKDQAAGESHMPPAEKSALDQRMGLGKETQQVVSSDFKLELGAFKAS